MGQTSFKDEVSPNQSMPISNYLTRFQLLFASVTLVRYPRPKDHTAVVCGDIIYVIGGADCPYSMEALDTDTQKWSKMPDIPSKCRASAACSHDGFIYVYGGFDLGLKVESNNRICIFNCTTGRWSDLSTNFDFKPQCKRSHHTLTECNGLLVSIGGMNGYKSISDTEYVALTPYATSNDRTTHEEESTTKSHVANHGLLSNFGSLTPVSVPTLDSNVEFSPAVVMTATSNRVATASEPAYSATSSDGPCEAFSCPETAALAASAPSAAVRVPSLKERLSAAAVSVKPADLKEAHGKVPVSIGSGLDSATTLASSPAVVLTATSNRVATASEPAYSATSSDGPIEAMQTYASSSVVAPTSAISHLELAPSQKW